MGMQPWAAQYIDPVEYANAERVKLERRREKIVLAILLTLIVIALSLTALFWETNIAMVANAPPETDPLDSKLYHQDRKPGVDNILETDLLDSKLYHKDRNPGPDNILLPRDLEGVSEIDNLPALDQCETSEDCDAGDFCFEHFCFENAASVIDDGDVSTSGSKKGKKRKPKKKPKKAPDFPPPQGCQVWSQPCEKDSDCCTLKCKKRGPEPALCESWKEWMPCKSDKDCWSGHCQRREDWVWNWKVCHPE